MRLPALVCTLALVPIGAAIPSATDAAPAPGGGAGAHPAYHATIDITRHGIPHITASSFGNLGFGSGYAASMDSICTLADTLVTARGQRSRWFGPAKRYNDQVTLDATNLQVDAFVRDLHQRHVVEKLLRSKKRGPGPQARAMVRGYVAGINRYVAQAGGPQGATDPACHGAPYLRGKARPIDLWYGVYLANLLASAGVFVPQIVDATPPSASAPVPAPPAAADVDRTRLLAALGHDPSSPFGSNATAVGGNATTTGKGMLLGNPHFPWRGRYRFTEQSLTIPGKYHVAGASLIGSPAVNIGWNRNVAWSHTVSTAYRFTPYEYHLVGPTTVVTEDGPTPLQHDHVTVPVRRKDGSLGKVHEDLWRTDQGFVLSDTDTLMPWTPASVWAIRDANGEQLRTLDTFLNMAKARNVHDLIRRQDAAGGMPWVNTTAADRHGDIVYADHSVVPNVSNALAQQCMTPAGQVLNQLAGLPGLDGTRAHSSCRWGTDPRAERPGIFGPGHLPIEYRRDWVTNANDSYWLPNPEQPLTGYARIIGCESCERTMRTRMVDHYVIDRLAAHHESPRSLRHSEYANRVMAAKVMRQGGALDQVCQQTGDTRACAILHDWDGRSDKTSRGTVIFEAFVDRLPAQGVWLTPFDPNDPLDTPRQLDANNPQLVQAMSDAIDALKAAHVRLGARWGSLQVAGDRGAPPIPLGGGTGDADGNVNALASRWPRANTSYYRPVTYGSSHIQAVAFEPHGRVNVRTILTYSQSENPRSPWSSDQTRLYGEERWVHFAWTPAQIQRQLVRTIHVHD
jgi:acyl-homoserine-lactone acylase